MLRIVTASVVGVSLFILAASPAKAEFAEPTVEQLAACEHYENRARFKPRSGEIEFVTYLAESCRAAILSLSGSRTGERAAAETFLARLGGLHNVIVSLTVERRFESHSPQNDTSAASRTNYVAFPRVSSAGEFLIAHRMGVISALEEWIDTGAQFSLAQRAAIRQ